MSRQTLVILAAILVMVLATLAMCAVPPSAGAQTPVRLAVRAVWGGDGARVAWPRVAGAAVVSIGRPGGRAPIGRPEMPTATNWSQGRTSLDAGLVLKPGDPVEVRIWDARSDLIAVGVGRLRWVVYVPGVRW
jgi:hypothetical protein